MKRFAQNELRAAYAHAAAGGQALHVCNSRQFVTAAAPACFRGSSMFAHLIDSDRVRLERTARRLGVRVVVVERVGAVGQHVDLCGGPLARAIALADELEKQVPRYPLGISDPVPKLEEFTQMYLGEFWNK